MSNLNKTLGLDQIGLNNVSKIHRNLNVDNLIDEILKNKEGVISSTGAPIVDTGKFTGRSPKDKYIVDEPSSNSQIWWGQVNQKIDEKVFDELFSKVVNYYNSDQNDTYMFDGYAGFDPKYSINVRIWLKELGRSILFITCS